jgi:hypothetical protein
VPYCPERLNYWWFDPSNAEFLELGQTRQIDVDLQLRRVSLIDAGRWWGYRPHRTESDVHAIGKKSADD